MNTSQVRPDLEKLQRLIKTHYPDAVFRISPSPELRRGVWLHVYSDLAEPMALADLVVPRELKILLKKISR